jgi:hypothetical protein
VDISPNGDIGSAPAESATAPVAATTTETVASGSSPTASDTTQPSSLTTDATTPGPIPYERFAEINRRMKDAEERYQGVEQSWGAVLRHGDPQRVSQAVEFAQRFSADPVESAVQILLEAQQNPQFSPRVASQAARLLGMFRNQQPKEDPEPQPDLVAENGLPVMSAQRLREWQGWMQGRQQREFDAKLEQTVAPFKSLVERQQQQELTLKTNQQADQQLQKARQWHGFKDHEAEIAKVFGENREFDLKDAYLHVLHTTILPAMPAKAQAQVVADLQSKAAAQTLNPSGATRPGSPDFKGDFKAALEYAAGKR